MTHPLDEPFGVLGDPQETPNPLDAKTQGLVESGTTTNGHYPTVRDIANLQPDQLEEIDGIGPSGVRVVQDALRSYLDRNGIRRVS